MRKVRWDRLPRAKWEHLRKRALEREISYNDLIRLDRWKQSDPIVPEGPWYKDFGTFKLAGEGQYASTFLTADQDAYGQGID